MKAFIKRMAENVQRFLGTSELVKVQTIQQVNEYERLRSILIDEMPQSVALYGRKVYSQTDEDGIIEEIFNRIPNNKTFLEIGIQTGIECNTHYLLLKGWKGVWIEGSKTYCDVMEKALGGASFPDKLAVVNSFIDKENIIGIFKEAHSFLKTKELDFFSLDIDGNDFYIMENLLNNGFTPKVVCVEYNAKFPPPLKMKIAYNQNNIWDYTDYMGCSLQDYIELFTKNDYTLICCNITGINAFFVRNEYASLFGLYAPEKFYQPYRFYLSPIIAHHKPSLKFLRDLLTQ